MRIIDTHAHLTDTVFAGDLPRVLQRAAEAGLEHIVTVGDDAESSRRALALCHQYEQLSATAGIHPQHAKSFSATALDKIAELADNPRVVAIGEIGLDYHYDSRAGAYQQPVFEKQLELARAKELPAVIHCREAYPDLLRILKKIENPLGGIVHCFSGSLEQGRALHKLGYKLGVGGTITYKNSDGLRAAVAGLPLESLVLETDAPYLPPLPKRGRRNEPALIKFSAHQLALKLGFSIYDVLRLTRLNAIAVFRLPLETRPALVYRIRDSLYLNVTNQCTNNCSFCGKRLNWNLLGHNLQLEGEPTGDQIIAQIDEPSKYREIVIDGYGEPTLRLQVVRELAQWCKQRGLKVRLNTNGHGDVINAPGAVCAALKDVVDVVAVSLNVSSGRQYINLCRPQNSKCSFEAVKKFILEAKDSFPEVYATAVELPGVNLKACRRVAEEELGVPFKVREFFEIA